MKHIRLNMFEVDVPLPSKFVIFFPESDYYFLSGRLATPYNPQSDTFVINTPERNESLSLLRKLPDTLVRMAADKTFDHYMVISFSPFVELIMKKGIKTGVLSHSDVTFVTQPAYNQFKVLELDKDAHYTLDKGELYTPMHYIYKMTLELL